MDFYLTRVSDEISLTTAKQVASNHPCTLTPSREEEVLNRFLNMGKRSNSSVSKKTLISTLILLLSGSDVSAWSTNQKAFRSSPSRQRKVDGPSTSKTALTTQNMMKNSVTSRLNTRAQQSRVRLSNSVLASCDTLPKFPTAHGMLSQEIVGRMEELNSPHTRSPALQFFLASYRNEGPMSCLPMLGDPQILPYLTEAMRDTLA